ncbi:MAG: NAD(P)-dependent oxidoreductase [Planctomycetota bacterium]
MRILVTGGSGYLGSAVVPALRARGHEVVTIGRHPGVDTAVCDLTDAEAVHKAVRAVGGCDTVVHLAARAHDFRGLSLDELILANTTTTRNLIAALRSEGRAGAVRFVHASSVAVYELLDATNLMSSAEAAYAASKLRAEQLLHAEPFQSLCVLRFAPIYDRAHLQGVAKRVFLPGTRLKLRLHPPPMHSLCSLTTGVAGIVTAVETSPETKRSIANVADAVPISQHELLEWFPGRSLPVPTSVLRTFARGASLCGGMGRKASLLIDKFVGSNRYPEPDWPSTLAR